jgi:propionyl-CoA carboxylase alpha chain
MHTVRLVPIRKLLVANRGEIAVRVFRSCAARGIATVAVAAADDTASLHARTAGETVAVGSYLDPDEHVRAALATGADAVHPGYGFLAESPAFAAAVEDAGLTWVGPPADTLRRGGDKLEAKRAADRAGVPTLPAGAPEEVGFPLVVKAAAGGGGRGMRVVRDPLALAGALASASREAEAAFGDGSVFCERYLERPRHVEVQLLADAHGHVHAVGERDCSVQRRHQKVLEEAPAPGLAPGVRGRLHEAAVAFARAIGYRNAGTAEFLVDGGEIYFLELNARIQVEHPVTEAVTGLDLVDAQLRVAEGVRIETLDVVPRGHAVEVRVYAEDPRSFLPQAGTVERLRLPEGVRVDAGIAEGDTIGIRYDPLVAKLVAHAADRAGALERLEAALHATVVGGVTTNLPFLRWLVAHPLVRAGALTTAFLHEHPPLSPRPLRVARGPWSEPWRLNLPAPPPAPAPDADAAAHVHAAARTESAVTAPMPGTVLRVDVRRGDRVLARQTLVVLEAMKLETPVHAPFDGTVSSVAVAPGDTVAAGQVVVELE